MEGRGLEDGAAAELAAMQFATGRSIAELAQECEREPAWVEAAIRTALLSKIPERDGGLKMPRAQERAEERDERSAEEQALRRSQGFLEFD